MDVASTHLPFVFMGLVISKKKGGNEFGLSHPLVPLSRAFEPCRISILGHYLFNAWFNDDDDKA